LRDEKLNKGNKKFKTRVNSASSNVISARGTTPSEDSNKVEMRLRENQLNESRSIEENSNS